MRATQTPKPYNCRLEHGEVLEPTVKRKNRGACIVPYTVYVLKSKRNTMISTSVYHSSVSINYIDPVVLLLGLYPVRTHSSTVVSTRSGFQQPDRGSFHDSEL